MDLKKLSIGIISNITLEPYFLSSLKQVFYDKKIKLYEILYNEKTDFKDKIKNSDIVVVLINFETQFADITNNNDGQDYVIKFCHNLYQEISTISAKKILWFLFEDCYAKYTNVLGCVYNSLVDKINITLSDTLKNNIVFLNLKHIISEVGIINAYNNKNKYRWNAPYSEEMIKSISKEIHKQYLIENGITKKCLVLDCDDVLWGGIVSEDGKSNIKLGNIGSGKFYKDFQQFIYTLYRHGVIVAICSKNDFDDIYYIFNEHSEMILKPEHIACFKVNWLTKAENISAISKELNIGLDSIIFIDDSMLEISMVNLILPEVKTILFNKNTIYEELSEFNLKDDVNLATIQARNNTYKFLEERKKLKSQFDMLDDYINALDIKIDFHKAKPSEFARISELTQRTNKCTNGKRYSYKDILNSNKEENNIMYAVYMSDRFSTYGLIGAIEIKRNMLSLFSLSCRALGVNIEDELLDNITQNYKIEKIYFVSTLKNEELKKKLKSYFPNVQFID